MHRLPFSPSDRDRKNRLHKETVIRDVCVRKLRRRRANKHTKDGENGFAFFFAKE